MNSLIPDLALNSGEEIIQRVFSRFADSPLHVRINLCRIIFDMGLDTVEKVWSRYIIYGPNNIEKFVRSIITDVHKYTEYDIRVFYSFVSILKGQGKLIRFPDFILRSYNPEYIIMCYTEKNGFNGFFAPVKFCICDKSEVDVSGMFSSSSSIERIFVDDAQIHAYYMYYSQMNPESFVKVKAKLILT